MPFTPGQTSTIPYFHSKILTHPYSHGYRTKNNSYQLNQTRNEISKRYVLGILVGSHSADANDPLFSETNSCPANPGRRT